MKDERIVFAVYKETDNGTLVPNKAIMFLEEAAIEKMARAISNEIEYGAGASTNFKLAEAALKALLEDK